MSVEDHAGVAAGRLQVTAGVAKGRADVVADDALTSAVWERLNANRSNSMLGACLPVRDYARFGLVLVLRYRLVLE